MGELDDMQGGPSDLLKCGSWFSLTDLRVGAAPARFGLLTWILQASGFAAFFNREVGGRGPLFEVFPLNVVDHFRIR